MLECATRVRRGQAGLLWRAVLCALLVLTGACPLGCRLRADDLDTALRRSTEGYRFRFLDWELHHLLRKGRLSPEGSEALAADHDARALMEHYLALTSYTVARRAQLRSAEAEGNPADGDLAALRLEVANLDGRLQAMSDAVESVLARQIRAALAGLSIHNPADRWVDSGIGFPPVWSEITQPPHVLVVSPRTEIIRSREVMLVPALTVAEMQEMEAEVEALGYSALVVRVGGFGGLYPSLVAESSSLSFLVEAVTEEWLHQYLAFTPLGFRYVLDLLRIARSYEVATLNETVAGIVSAEVGRQVLATYYPEHLPSEAEETSPPTGGTGFSYSREMRSIRLRVDDLLAAGQVEEAEAHMEERRQYLGSQGYHIRKLNQAYFAFYGTYAAEPTSVDPIGEEVRLLMSRSDSLSDFLNRMVAITSRAELRGALGLAP